MDILLGIKMPQREQVLAPYQTLAAGSSRSHNTNSGSHASSSLAYESAITMKDIAQPLNYPQRTSSSAASYVGKENMGASKAALARTADFMSDYGGRRSFSSSVEPPESIVNTYRKKGGTVFDPPRDFFIKVLILREGVDEAEGGANSFHTAASTEKKNAAEVSTLHLFIKSEREKGFGLGPAAVLHHPHAFLSPERHGERGEVALLASPEGERNTLYDLPPLPRGSELPAATSKCEVVSTTSFDQNDDDEPALEIPNEIFFVVPNCRSTKHLFRSIQRKIRRDLGIPYLKAKAIYFREDLAEAKKRERDAIEQKLQELVQLGSKASDGADVAGGDDGSVAGVSPFSFSSRRRPSTVISEHTLNHPPLYNEKKTPHAVSVASPSPANPYSLNNKGRSGSEVVVGSSSNVDGGEDLLPRLPPTDSAYTSSQLNSTALGSMKSLIVEEYPQQQQSIRRGSTVVGRGNTSVDNSSSVTPLQSHSLPPPPKIPESIAKLLENARRLAGQGQREGEGANFSSGQTATTLAPSESDPSAKNRSVSSAGGLVSSRRSSSTFTSNPSQQNLKEDGNALVERDGTKENVGSSGIRSASIDNNSNEKNYIVETPPSASLTPLLYPKSTTAPASEASDNDDDKEYHLPHRKSFLRDSPDDRDGADTRANSEGKDDRNLRKGPWYSIDDEGTVSLLQTTGPSSSSFSFSTSPQATVLADLPLTTNPPIVESAIQTKARRLHLIITCLSNPKEVERLTSSANKTSKVKNPTIDPFTGLPTELFQRKGTVYASNLSDLSQFVAKVLGVTTVKNHQILFCNPREHERHRDVGTNSLGNRGVSHLMGGNTSNNYGFDAYVSLDRSSSSSSSDNDGEKSDGQDKNSLTHSIRNQFADPYCDSKNRLRKNPSTATTARPKQVSPSILEQMSGGTLLRDSTAQQNAVLSYLNGVGSASSNVGSDGANTERSSFPQPHTNLPSESDTLPSLALPAILLYKQLQHIGQLAKVSYIICDLTDPGDGQLKTLSSATSVIRQQRDTRGPVGHKNNTTERSYALVEPKLGAKDTTHNEYDGHNDTRHAPQVEAYSLLPVDRVGKGHYLSELAVYKPEFDLTRRRVIDDNRDDKINQKMNQTHHSISAHREVFSGRVGDSDLERIGKREAQNDIPFGSSDHERGGDISFSPSGHERGGTEYHEVTLHEDSERWGRPPRDNLVQHFRVPDLSAVDSWQATSGTYVIDFGKQVSDEAAVKGLRPSASHSTLFSDKPNHYPNDPSGVDGVKLRTPVPQDAPLFLPSSRTCYNNSSATSLYDVNAAGSQQQTALLSSPTSCSATERRALIQFTLNHYIQTHPTALKIFTESQLTTLTGEVVVRFRKEREATHGHLPLHFPLGASDAASLRHIADTVASEVIEQKQIRDAEQRFLADNGLLPTVKKTSNHQATNWQNVTANSSTSEVGGPTPLLREFTLTGFYDENNNDTSHDARLKMRNRIDPYYVPPVPSVRAGLDPQSRQALALREAYETEYAAKLSRRIRLQTPASEARHVQDKKAGRKGRGSSGTNGYYLRQPILYEDDEEKEASRHHADAGKSGNAPTLGLLANNNKNRIDRTRLTLIALPLKFNSDDLSSDDEDGKQEKENYFTNQTSYPRDRNDSQWLTNNKRRSVRRESKKAEVIATLKRLLSDPAAVLPPPRIGSLSSSDPFKRRIVMADPQWDQTQKRLAIYITTSIDIFGGSSVAHAKAARDYLSSSYFIRGDGNIGNSSRGAVPTLASLYNKGPPPFRFYITTGQRRKPVSVELPSLQTSEQVNFSGGGWSRSGSTTSHQTTTLAPSSARDDHQEEHHFADDIGLDALLDLGIATVHVIQHTVPVTFSLEIDLDPERDFRAIEEAYNERVKHIKSIAGRFDQQSTIQGGLKGFADPKKAPLLNSSASRHLSSSEAAIERERRKFLTDTYSVLFNRYMSLLRAVTPQLSHPFSMDDFYSSSSFSTTPHKTISDVDRKIAQTFFKSRDSFALLQDAAAVSSGSPRQLLASDESDEGHRDAEPNADSPDANTSGVAVDLKSPTTKRYPVATSIFVPSLLREGLPYTVGVDVYDAENDVVFRAEKGFAILRGAGLAISFDEYLRRAAQQAGYRY